MGAIVSSPEATSRWKLGVLYVAPTLLLLIAVVLPLVVGSETLFMRDVFNTHFEMKWAEAQALRQGYLPLIDPQRAGGQPLLGNPNAVPLYPDNVLYLLAPVLWALNAHFWLHLLLAPFAGFWMARAWGLGRGAAWATGVVYVASGYFLSQMNLYNLVAVAALAPALVAATLRLGEAGGRRRLRFAALALLWTLLILAGDPVTASLALALALTAGAALHGRGYPWARACAAVLVGTLIAAPQWVEMLRILESSFRGFWGFTGEAALVASFHPAKLLEMVLPLPFGRPGFRFFGGELHVGVLPLFPSLYPGVLTLALVGIARPGARRRLWVWSWITLAAGAFLALGGYNPVVPWLLKLAHVQLLRAPVKAWLAVALGGSLLCGLGFERLTEGGASRAFSKAVGLLAALYAAAFVLLRFAVRPVVDAVTALSPKVFAAGFAGFGRANWVVYCLLTVVLLAAYWGCGRLVRRSPVGAGAALLAVHLASQLLFLGSILPTDLVAPYLEKPPLVAELDGFRRIVHADAEEILGKGAIPFRDYPDDRLFWWTRQQHRELDDWTGVRWGFDYDFDVSPEGLDAFLTRVTHDIMRDLSQRDVLRLLAAAGVQVVLYKIDLDEDAAVLLRPLASEKVTGGMLHASEIVGTADQFQMVGQVVGSGSVDEAIQRMLAPDFDPRRAVVLAGAHQPLRGRRGEVELDSESAEAMELSVEAPDPGVLLVQRAYLPLYRAEIDGVPAHPVAGNVHRLALPLEAGHHRVRIWIDRRPLWISGAAALAALMALAVWMAWGALQRRVADR